MILYIYQTDLELDMMMLKKELEEFEISFLCRM